DAAVPVIVVVRLPERAEGVDADLVVVSEVLPERFKFRAVEIATKHHALAVGFAIAADFIAGLVHHGIGYDFGQWTMQRAFLRKRPLDLPAFVPHIEIELAVGSKYKGMHAVV